jgi:2-polyprenyl-6-methoxyphenol hydroxylase-like FAD-dependent oxidoreductase
MAIVLVVGAGPTGLTLARSLRGRGFTVRHIDSAAAPALTSRAFGIQARTLEVLEQFSLADEVLARAHRIRGAAFHLSSGRPTRIDLAPVHPRFPPMVLLAQAETERLLVEPGHEPERGVAFVGLDGHTATLRHADGLEERMEADWIVGCDGAHSAVRKAIGVEFCGEQLPVQAGLADGLCEGLDRERIHLIPAKDRLLAWFPLPAPSDRPLWRAIVLVPASASPLPAKASAAPFAHPKMPPFGEIEWYSCFRISSRQVPFVRQGNVLLCGDAAHIHSPAGGQGMNLGIQDAWSLAAALSRGGSAVDEWATTRHAVASQVIRATDMATRMMISSSPIVAAARRLAVGVLARAPVLRGKFSAILAGMNYPPLPE